MISGLGVMIEGLGSIIWGLWFMLSDLNLPQRSCVRGFGFGVHDFI